MIFPRSSEGKKFKSEEMHLEEQHIEILPATRPRRPLGDSGDSMNRTAVKTNHGTYCCLQILCLYVPQWIK